jgi:hypothetical protein
MPALGSGRSLLGQFRDHRLGSDQKTCNRLEGGAHDLRQVNDALLKTKVLS